MTQADTQMRSFLSDFFEVWLFQHLPSQLRNGLVPKLRLCSFHPGELIYPPKELPSVVHCIMQGQVRVLGPESYQNPTLERLGRGDVIGWDSLLRRTAVGSVRAAMAEGEQEVLTLALPADEFEVLALQHLMPALTQRASAIEVFDTLSHFLSQSPTTSGLDLKAIVRYICQNDAANLVTVQHCQISQAGLSEPQLTPDRLWLVSGGESLKVPIGTLVRHPEELSLHRPARFPVRLLGFDRSFLTSDVLSGSLVSAPDAETSVTSFSLPGVSMPGMSLPAASSSLSAPNYQGDGAALSLLHTAIEPSSTTYPIWKSSLADPDEDLVACFGMVCERLQVPYRPDTLRRWLQKNNSREKFDDPFELYTRIAQALGLHAHVVNFTPTPGGLNRLSTPAFLEARHVLTVLHDATLATVVVGSPRTGLLHIDATVFAARLAADASASGAQGNSTCQALVIERFETTPTKRLSFRRFWPIVSSQQGILIQVLLASIVIQLLGVANPLLVQQVIDNVISKANPDAMTMFGILMVTFALLEGVLTILRTYLLVSTTNRIDLNLGIEIVRHMLRLPLSFFESRPVGELSARLGELENIRQFLTDTALTTVLDVLFSVLYIAVMFLYSVPLTFCVLATIPVVIISTLIMASIQKRLIRAKADQGAKVQAYLVEILGGISAVKAQHMESLVEATWRERYVQYLTTGFTTTTVNSIFYSYSNFLNVFSSLLVLWVGAGLVLEAKLTLGGLIAFRILTGYVTGPLLRLARLWQRFQETALSMELLADIADAPAEALLPEKQRTDLQLPAIQGRVQFQEVSFSFKPGQLQLSNINLDIAPGTFVGIVGQSGSGKSTLMKLLPRLYEPQTGSIMIDGYDIRKVSLSSLRSQVGIVSQDAVLFQGSIRDNIALFEEISDELIMEAARVADAHDFIMQLSDGYNTQIGERGASLSGGQRQRIAIARVVLKNPKLLIFDEATSALDVETERNVCRNLMQKFPDRTCFFITHRLNTIARADWILFLQSGMLAEQGSHHDLMAHRQLYYCLYAQQARQV